MPTRSRPGTAASALLGMLAIAVIAGVMVAVAVTPAIALTGTTAKNGIGIFEQLPDDLTITPLDQKTEIYAKSGDTNVLIASFYAQNRQVVGWDDISQVAKNAAIAGEDVRFYDHGGVDPLGIVRATVANLSGKDLQGASTITQQYVKNVCVQEAENESTTKKVDAAYAICTDTSVGRKLREARYAIALEKKYKKNQILLGYLNIAGFGGRIYGIESAAEYYYDTTAAKLTVAQAASLMAIVNNPQYLRLDMKANYAANKERRDYILDVELKNKLITQAQYTEAVATPIEPKITQTKTGCQAAGVAGYFCDYVYNTVLSSPEFGKDKTTRLANLERSGWKIYTTLDLGIEKKAQSAMNTYVPKTSQVFKVGGASVSVEVGTGRIISMVQNKTFNNSDSSSKSETSVNYNANLLLGASSGWQPGSTFKLFTLLQWLKTGHTLNQTVDANPGSRAASTFTVCGKNYASLGGEAWPVGNDPGDPGGTQSVLNSTALSINGAFASMAQQLDLCDIQDLAKSMGVTPATSTTFPSIVAPMVIGGAYGVSPVSMAGAYATIANNGIYCAPVAIDKVVRTDGSELPVPQTGCKRVLDQGVAIAAAYALRGVMTSGTASGDKTADGIYEFGKTGTTDNAYDTWMDGTTSKVTTVVWVGNNGVLKKGDAKQSLRLTSFDTKPCYLSGGGTAAIARHCVWHDIQTAINKEYGGATDWAQPDAQYLYGGTSNDTTTNPTGAVPDVTGQSLDAAEAALVAAGYTWALNGTVTSSQPTGAVAATSPAAGTAAAAGSQVTIQTSDGTG